MIKTEIVTINNKQFICTWSDEGFMIYGGEPEENYSMAYDPIEFNREYIETDIPIEESDEINENEGG